MAIIMEHCTEVYSGYLQLKIFEVERERETRGTGASSCTEKRVSVGPVFVVVEIE